jgi:hypothetical protein
VDLKRDSAVKGCCRSSTAWTGDEVTPWKKFVVLQGFFHYLIIERTVTSVETAKRILYPMV